VPDKPTFTPFKNPVHPDDTPLVQHAGFEYKCTGCGAPVPDGVHIYETVEDGMVIGLKVRRGLEGPVLHACGSEAQD
jgi:hypothetical protein